MAKTRLNKADREHIAKAIIDYKYQPQIALNRAHEYQLAKLVYERVYTADIRKKMSALPEGAFPETDTLLAAVNGQKFKLEVCADCSDELGVNLGYDISREDRPLVRVMYKHNDAQRYNASPMLSITDEDALGAELVEWRHDRDRLITEPDEMRRKLDATLSQFLYFDDLVSQFPEAESFILKRWRERPEGGSPGVPAVVIKDLAKALDLPPEVGAVAA